MPATAGRVRMPANNRVHSSAALQTHGIWQSAIGYDPYAPSAKSDPNHHNFSSASKPDPDSSVAEPGSDNAYASFQGLLALARITGSNADETRGACKKCGRIGHLTFQCRNFLSVKEDLENNESATEKAANLMFDKIKKGKQKVEDESVESDDEEESESSDSDVDPEMERIIAERFGWKRAEMKKRGRSKKWSRKRSKRSDDTDEDEDEDERRRNDKRRRKHRDSNDNDDDEKDKRKSRKEKRSHRRSKDEDSGEESEEKSDRHKSRRRRHWRHRKGKRNDSESSDSDGEWVRRKKRSEEKRTSQRRYERKLGGW